MNVITQNINELFEAGPMAMIEVLQRGLSISQSEWNNVMQEKLGAARQLMEDGGPDEMFKMMKANAGLEFVRHAAEEMVGAEKHPKNAANVVLASAILIAVYKAQYDKLKKNYDDITVGLDSVITGASKA